MPLFENTAKRRFSIPSNFDLLRMLNDLSLWLEREKDKKTIQRRTSEGYIIEVSAASGRFKRWIKRNEKLFHLAFRKEKNDLHVLKKRGSWKERKTGGEKEIPSFSAKAAEYAKNTAAELTQVAADAMIKKKTQEEIFEYIGRYIENSFKASSYKGMKDAGIFPIEASKSHFVEEFTSINSSWLSAYIDSEEILIAWLQTASPAPEEASGCWTWFLTTHRSGLVSFSSAGFEAVREIEARSMSFSGSIGRSRVKSGHATWKTRLSNENLFKQIAPLLPFPPEKRLYEAARLNFFRSKNKKEDFRYSLKVMEYLAPKRRSPIYTLTAFFLRHALQKGDEPFAVDKNSVISFHPIVKYLSEESSGENLLQWRRAWNLSAPQALSLVELILKTNPESIEYAELVRPTLNDVRKSLLKKNKNIFFQGIIDIQYAENLVICGFYQEAKAVLENRLTMLPDESFSDLLPADDSDLTIGEGGQILRTRILELLVQTRNVSGKPDAKTLRELAVRQPLVTSRMESLIEAGEPEVKKRASNCLQLLMGEKKNVIEEEKDEKKRNLFPNSALTEEELEGKIRHPASRGESALNRIQGLIASKKIPDHNMLKSIAKRITREEHAELFTAIEDAGLIFQVQSPEGYISFGERNTGVRGYESNPPFILIGNEHLVKHGSHEMSVTELRFLIGSEIANLKFKFNRITSADVWEGAFEKTISAIDLIPVIGGALGKIGSLGKFAVQAGQFSSALGNAKQYASHAWSIASRAQEVYRGKSGKQIKKPEEDQPNQKREEEAEIIGAFREMRLTLDRAGLVLCGDLKSAVRAVIKSSPKFRDHLPEMEEIGLNAFLSRKDEKGELLYQNLAVRLAALFSFYLSEDFESLRSSVFK